MDSSVWIGLWYCTVLLGMGTTVSGRWLTYYTATKDSAVYIDGSVVSLVEKEDTASCIYGYSGEVLNTVHVIGIKANNSVVSDVCSNRTFIIASTNDSYILTNSSWKCTNQTPDESWTKDGYDDSCWSNARSKSVSDALADINTNARQIWTWNISDNLVYCRLFLAGNQTNSTELACPDSRNHRTSTSGGMETVTRPNTDSRKYNLTLASREDETVTNTGAIIGGVVGGIGGVLVIAVLVLVICFIAKRKRRSTTPTWSDGRYVESPYANPNNDPSDQMYDEAAGRESIAYQGRGNSNRLTLHPGNTYEDPEFTSDYQNSNGGSGYHNVTDDPGSDYTNAPAAGHSNDDTIVVDNNLYGRNSTVVQGDSAEVEDDDTILVENNLYG